MKRKQLVNLDSHTLDRIAGGCQVVATNAFGIKQKLQAAQSLMDLAVMPANYADIREAALPAVTELLPAAHDIMSLADDQIAETQIAATDIGTALGVDEIATLDDMVVQGGASNDSLLDLPVNWCGTGSQGMWEDCDADEAEQPIADTEAKDQESDPILAEVAEQVIAPPTIRDHRAASIAASAAAANAPDPIIRDHRPAVGGASDVSQPIVRDQR